MDEILSIFKNDAFSATTLDRLAPNVPYVPQALGRMNIFQNVPIRTKSIEVYTENGIIQMVPTSERGSPEPLPYRPDGEIRTLYTYRLAQRDRIHAEEVQDLILMALGSPAQLARAMDEVTKRSTQMRNNNEMTLEAHRLGAIQGKVLDADGTTVVRNFFTDFGIAEPAEIFFDFTSIAAGQLSNFITDNIVRPMMRSLKNRKNPGTRIGALVGDAFWAKLTSHIDVRATFLNWQAAQSLRTNNTGAPDNGMGNAWNEFTYSGVTFINYMGTDDGTTIAIGSEKARFFPIGATDVFKTYWSPGERFRDVNTAGQPAYLIVQPDPRTEQEEWVDVLFRNYPLFACVFPQALLKGRSA